MTTSTLSIDDLRSHIGRSITSTDVIHPGPANLLRLAFGRQSPSSSPGRPPPPGLPSTSCRASAPTSCVPTAARATRGGAGHAAAAPHVRGESVRFHRALRIGEAVRRETELADISVKSGGTGTLVFATVASRVFGPDGLALEEERRTVFREEVKAGSATSRRAVTRRPPT